MSGVVTGLDLAAVLRVAEANGVAPVLAAPLIAAVEEGMVSALAERAETE